MISSISKPVMKASSYALIMTCLLLLSGASVISLLVPTEELHTEAPFIESFSEFGIHWMRFIIGFAALFSLFPSMLYTFIQLVKLAYDMAYDGLIFHVCQHTSNTLDSPLVPSIVFGIFCSIFTMIFNLTTLVQMISFTSLSTTLLVSIVVIMLKYHPSTMQSPLREHRATLESPQREQASKLQNPHHMTNKETQKPSAMQYGTNPVATNSAARCDNVHSQNVQVRSHTTLDGTSLEESNTQHNDSDSELIENVADDSSSDTDIDDVVEEYKIKSILTCKTGSRSRAAPTEASSFQAKIAVTLFSIWIFCFALVAIHGTQQILAGDGIIISILVFFLILSICSVMHLLCQPQDTVMNPYYLIVTPGGPMIPLLCITFCIHFLLLLPLLVWITVLTWIITGMNRSSDSNLLNNYLYTHWLKMKTWTPSYYSRPFVS